MTAPTESRPSHEAISAERHTMAMVLESRHGIHAADVADFFASVHQELGDKLRAHAWSGVAGLVREREAARLADDMMAENDF